jgi:probable phosphoglycerate mutase
LVRHAEVENPNDIEYMRLPGFGLSAWGRKQASELADFFEDKNISHIYASPLLRTKETAKIIAKGKLKISYCDELIEANFRKWEGIKRSERPKLEVEGYYNHPVKYSAILGESLADIQKRVMGKIFEIVENNQGRNMLIVSHASPVILASLFFRREPLSKFSKTTVNYAGVTTITFDNELECIGIHYNEYVGQREDENE